MEHEQLTKRSREEKLRGEVKSYVEEVFGGQFLSTVVCLEC